MYTADMLDDLFEKLVDDYKSKEYEKCRNICIENNLNFALETPFADNFGLDEVLLFKKKGYSINGILFGLNTVEESIANVALRVQKKGHDLLLESISWNFKHSYLNVYNHINLFDQLHFVHAQSVAENPFYSHLIRKALSIFLLHSFLSHYGLGFLHNIHIKLEYSPFFVILSFFNIEGG